MACQTKTHKADNRRAGLARRLLCAPIRFYRYFLSSLTGSNCRFYPSCSEYSIEAIESLGPAKGGYLSIKRILKCHPWHPGGNDPVPSNGISTTDTDSSNQQHSGSTT